MLRSRRLSLPLFLLSLLLAPTSPLSARAPTIHEIRLDNGMTVLVVPWPGRALVAAGWVVHAGSASEQPGTTGVAHLVEHLMFRGTEIIGTRGFDREQPLLAERERLEDELRSLLPADDAVEPGSAASAATPRAASAPARDAARIQRDISRLDAQLRDLRVVGEYALHYTEAGARGIDALTNRDFSVYHLLLPQSRLELWFWMESDRLLHPVFRDLYGEYEVIEQERGQRVGSTPTGPARERFDTAFWGAGHPYSWLPVGLAEDLRNLRTSDADRFFDRYYQPAGLTAAIVGDVDVQQVEQLARRYFGRLGTGGGSAPRGSNPPAGGGVSGSTTTTATRPLLLPAPPLQSLDDTCDCRPQVEARYLTVPFGHPDQPALEVLSGLLNGRTGRLHRRLVLEREVAFSASAQTASLREAGTFSLYAESRADASPDELLRELDAALEELRAQLRAGELPELELEKVRNQIDADAARQVEEPGALRLRLLLFAALGDWRYVERWNEDARRVTPADLLQVLDRYFVPNRRAILRLTRGAPPAA